MKLFGDTTLSSSYIRKNWYPLNICEKCLRISFILFVISFSFSSINFNSLSFGSLSEGPRYTISPVIPQDRSTSMLEDESDVCNLTTKVGEAGSRTGPILKL